MTMDTGTRCRMALLPGGAVVPGQPNQCRMHTATFTATTPGTYHYLCPVPGHAQEGMTGTFTVSNSS